MGHSEDNAVLYWLFVCVMTVLTIKMIQLVYVVYCLSGYTLCLFFLFVLFSSLSFHVCLPRPSLSLCVLFYSSFSLCLFVYCSRLSVSRFLLCLFSWHSPSPPPFSLSLSSLSPYFSFALSLIHNSFLFLSLSSIFHLPLHLPLLEKKFSLYTRSTTSGCRGLNYSHMILFLIIGNHYMFSSVFVRYSYCNSFDTLPSLSR